MTCRRMAVGAHVGLPELYGFEVAASKTACPQRVLSVHCKETLGCVLVAGRSWSMGDAEAGGASLKLAVD
jgi:hypothetical protein